MLDKTLHQKNNNSQRLPHQRWHIFPEKIELAQQLAEAGELPLVLAQVLINRGIETKTAEEIFLNPDINELPSAITEFPDLEISLELLQSAIAQGKKIAICGDYDADGMTSTALLLRSLRKLGAIVDYAIPSRMQEGYGINNRIVEEFYREGVKLILTVDNGISAHTPVAKARELGLDIIITDHHDIPPTLPIANAILNPKLIPENSPYRGIAGVGVAYILAISLAEKLGQSQGLTNPLLALFTLGTIADLAPLTGVNRRLVKKGLRLLPESEILGIQALIKVAGIETQSKANQQLTILENQSNYPSKNTPKNQKSKTLKPDDIGFSLGPRINAVGRIADPQIVIELLTTETAEIALKRAWECEEINQKRQKLCADIEQEAIAWIENSQIDLQQQRILVIVQKNWHHGVIGIVASRLVERYGVPVFIGTYEEENPDNLAATTPQLKIRGSARSIPEFDVFAALQFCDDLLTKYGGHKAAGGFSLLADNLEKFQNRLSQFACQCLEIHHLKPLIQIDARNDFTNINLDLYRKIDLIHPCGIENPQPIFWTPNVRVLEQKIVGQNHIKFTFAQEIQGENIRFYGIAWRWGEYYPLPTRVDIAYHLRDNTWNGKTTMELEVIGVRLPSGDNHILPMQNTSAKAEFYYQNRKYICSLSQNGVLPELRIKNDRGEVLAIEKGQKIGLKGKSREDATQVDVTKPPYFNLIKEAVSALETVQKPEVIPDQNQIIIEKDKQIDALNQEIIKLNQSLLKLLAENQKHQTPETPQLTPPEPDDNLLEVLLGEKNQIIVEKEQENLLLRQELDELKQEISRLNHVVETIETIENNQIQAEDNIRDNIRDNISNEVDLEPERSPENSVNISPNENQIQLHDKITQKLIAEIGENIWLNLQEFTQKNLDLAYKQYKLISGDKKSTSKRTNPKVNYEEIGLALCLAVEKEILEPYFHNLSQFLVDNDSEEIGGIVIANNSEYRLDMLPTLIANEWESFKDEALTQEKLPYRDDLYEMVLVESAITETDKYLIQDFLQQWQHPLSYWLAQGKIAASTLDQIAKLRRCIVEEKYLYDWQLEKLRVLIFGNKTKPGIFYQIYGNK